ncbi:TPA_asm: coat protein [ssRNA phage SRR6255733_6]|uniref:Coat protein n=1 Tax=ssRNA phage SRR6255733_6 TaxID=2786502 RepID=A0A8S5L0I7_9VIRU|nr:coat protein [ssRNA phage SRR6255733_6]DAD50943.1 TPA_asm: coat protein [ssRNA phage SRR6255733_6]
MALPDQSVTIGGTTTSLPRTGAAMNQGVFKSNDGLITETASHNVNGKRTRSLFRLDHRKVAADPFLTGVNTEYAMSCYIVFDVPNVGYTVAERKAVWDGLSAQLSASSGALVTKLLGQES